MDAPEFGLGKRAATSMPERSVIPWAPGASFVIPPCLPQTAQ